MSDRYQEAFSPADYLRQYYATPHVPGDCVAIFRFLAAHLPRRACGYPRAIDFGCGPTLYAAFALAPHVGELHLADYLPANLAELRRWLDNAPSAHDWDTYLRGQLEVEAPQLVTREHVEARKALLRRKVTALLHADVRSPHPLGEPCTYDLVLSCFCLEAIQPDRRVWAEHLANLARLVGPGGELYLAVVRRCREYHVFDQTFATTYLDEADFAAELPRPGFTAEVEVVTVPEWAGQGFDSICLVRATNPGRSHEKHEAR